MFYRDSSTFLKVSVQRVIYTNETLQKLHLNLLGHTIVESAQRLLPTFRRHWTATAKLYTRRRPR